MAYQRCDGAEFGSSDYHEAEPGAPDLLCAACRKVMLATPVPTTWERFALKRPDGRFEHFYHSTMQVGMCGGTSDNMYLVRLTRNETGPYWGWYYSFHPNNGSSRGEASMIYLSEVQTRVCFAYGPEAETKRGRGEIIRLGVEEVRPAKHPEGIR